MTEPTPATQPSAEAEELVIEAGRTGRRYWGDLWRYRDLLFFLAWRDVKVRYKQATLGVAWALLQPIVTMVMFTFVFSKLAGMPSGGVPYPLLVLAGLLPWQLFSGALSGSSASLVGNAQLISKVYFPRMAAPLSALAVALLDFAVAFGLYLVLAGWFGFWPSWRLLFLPVFMLIVLLASLGAGLWLTALTVKYRDFRFIVPFLLQFGIFATPIGYRADAAPNWHVVLAINPLTAVIEGFRWCLLGEGFPVNLGDFAFSLPTIALLLVTGVWYFRRTERAIADIL